MTSPVYYSVYIIWFMFDCPQSVFSVLHCVAVLCSVVVARKVCVVCFTVLQCIRGLQSVLQCVA